MGNTGKSGKVTELVTELARPIVEGIGCELWDVEYLKEGGQWYLRVYIDRDGGVSIDDCEAVSRALDPILDERDPIPDSYVFEVSSAGLERKLYRPSDFERYMGELVSVTLYRAREGSKEFVGTLTGYDEGAVTVDIGGAAARFEKNEVASVHLRVEL